MSEDNGLTGANHQESTSTMIAPRRPPSSRPFLAAPRTDFYHPARAIDAALMGIERAIRRSEGIGLVVGPPGTGKTLLLAKLAEHVRDDFDVALLSGARICTRRALWQGVLAEIGEPYRGIDEGDLRIGVVERVRGLAAGGSGLVILVDEAHTLPTRLLEELRLLTNIPTPLPSVHVVLAGTREMDERLGMPRMESLAQRIGARFYLEPLDHDETMAYLRTQMKVAGLQWDVAFESGSDAAVFAATDGVPRLINQLCDLALVQAGEAGRKRVGPRDIDAAWREIQRLPASSFGQGIERERPMADPRPTPSRTAIDAGEEPQGAIVEFGAFDDDLDDAHGGGVSLDDGAIDVDGLFLDPTDPDADLPASEHPSPCRDRGPSPSGNPWSGPEVELVFDGIEDPFAEYFADAERVVERYVVRGPDDFSERRHVASREGASLSRQLPVPGVAATDVVAEATPAVVAAAPSPVIDTTDDADMVVIEEDLWMPPPEADRRVVPVRLGDYRRLFARMRRGGSAE